MKQEDLIKQIDSLNDKEALAEYLDALEDVYHLNKIDEITYLTLVSRTNQKIDTLNNPPKEEKISNIPNEGEKEMTKDIQSLSVAEFGKLLVQKENGEEITPEEETMMSNFAFSILQEMRDAQTDSYRQNAIECYIEYLNEKGDNLSSSERQILGSYKQITEPIMTNNLANEKNKPKVLKLVRDDHHGAIVTVAIIEATVLLGILLSYLAFALK